MSINSNEVIKDVEEKRKELKLDFILNDLNSLLKESLEGADRVKFIVENLKGFARPGDDTPVYADINKCIGSALNLIWNELKYKADVKTEYGDIPLTICNPQNMNQVFMNILVNAAHAIEKYGEIMIKTWHKEDSIFISIADTGCGISEEHLKRIFDPFFSTKEVGAGTGLGLSISYDIVKKHNGNITVQSENGKGATFIVRIPVQGKS